MTAERAKAINEWLGIHCPKCTYNDDRGTDFVNCQAECEVQKDIGIVCIHYEEAHDIEPQESMQIVIEIPKEMHKALVQGSFGTKYNMYDLVGCVMNGTPLPEYMKELKRRLLMEVDGGTDDRYLRYADVCDRISNTIDTYIKAESEEQ